MSGKIDKEGRKSEGLDDEVKHTLSLLLSELRSTPVPKRIEGLAAELQALLDDRDRTSNRKS